MRTFLFAWVARAFRQLSCPRHIWSFDGTVLRKPDELCAVRHRCERCGATDITYQKAK